MARGLHVNEIKLPCFWMHVQLVPVIWCDFMDINMCKTWCSSGLKIPIIFLRKLSYHRLMAAWSYETHQFNGPVCHHPCIPADMMYLDHGAGVLLSVADSSGRLSLIICF